MMTDITIHHVVSVEKVQKQVNDTRWTTLAVTDKHGNVSSITLFNADVTVAIEGLEDE
jgi:hypothetical protein